MARAIPTFGLFLLLALGAVAWGQCREQAPPPSGGGVGDDGAGAAVAEPATPVASASPAETAQGARVWIEIEAKARLHPAAPALIQIVQQGAVVAAQTAILAGDAQEWPDAAPTRGPVLVRVAWQGMVAHRLADRRDDGSLGIELGPVRSLQGRIVDRAAAPIAGAHVWCGAAADQDAVTDDDGRFTAAVPSGRGVPVVVRADGKAWKFRFVEVGEGGTNVDFVLGAEQPLQVQVSGVDVSLRDASVAAVPSGGVSAVDTEVQQYPFFAAALFGDVPIDVSGAAVLRGLPPSGNVGVVVCGPAMVGTRVDDVSLRRVPARVDVAVERLPLVSGVVVDAKGAPVAGAEVWCWPEGSSVLACKRAAVLLPTLQAAPGATVTVSGADGTFALALPRSRGIVLGARNRSGHATELALAATPTEPVRLLLPDEVAAASLVVAPPTPNEAWAVRVDPGTEGRFVEFAAGQDAIVPLGRPLVGDLRVRVVDGDSWSAPRCLPFVAVTGAFRLPPELTHR